METDSRAIRPLNPKVIIGIATVVCVVIMSLIVKLWIDDVLYKNPYGDEIKISNFDEYFKDTPEDYKERIFHNLYNIVKRNAPSENLDEIAGEVRASSVERNFNPETDVHYDTFLVDLEVVKQSYRVQFEWSANKTNQYIVGANVMLTCPRNSELIYGGWDCIDIFTEQKEVTNGLHNEFPIMASLPIDIAYYDRKTGRYISYRIVGVLSDDEPKEYKIAITDRSGGNYELALDRIRELQCGSVKCNPDDYKIEYRDASTEGDAEVKF